MQKPQRWYEQDKSTGEIYVYNASRPKYATSCSTVTKADLPYYRRTYELRRTEVCGECHLRAGERCDICGSLNA